MPEDVRQPLPETAERHLDRVLGKAHFAERHRRVIRAPADRVWNAVLAVTSREVRLLAPLMAVRSLPTIIRRPGSVRRRVDRPLLDAFEAAGFLCLHRDPAPVDGRAFVVYGAVGRFWSPANNQPVRFEDRQAFEAYTRAGMAKTAFFMEVVERAGHCEVRTETRIVGTDAAARRAFAAYWFLIRGPSGLIRRSWLAAIDRRATS
jgi:hypothetical protein